MKVGALRDTFLPKRFCGELDMQDAKRFVADATA